jgi:hypothetical protein
MAYSTGKSSFQQTLPMATISIPAADVASVNKSGQPAHKAASVRFVRTEYEQAIFAVGFGPYSFASPLPK